MKSILVPLVLRLRREILLPAGLCLLAGCGLVVGGAQGFKSTVEFHTEPMGARCELYREGGRLGGVEVTPGVITYVSAGYSPIKYECNLPCYETYRDVLECNSVDPFYRNLITSFGVGQLIDVATGTDCIYPEKVYLKLREVDVPFGTRTRIYDLDDALRQGRISKEQHETQKVRIIEECRQGLRDAGSQ